MVLVPVAKLEQVCADTFARVGSTPEEAVRVARSLIGANLTGHDSHGVIRVPRYVDWVKSGDITPNQSVALLVDTPALAVVDGRYGYGQTVAPEAVRIGIAKAQGAGLAAVALRDAGHIGRIGEWAEMAAAQGLISIHFVTASGSILVAPFGARERRLSTAPFCVGIPREGQEPVILDFATSVVAEGKVMVASQGGKKLPDGALIGPDGDLSTDPAMLYGPYTPEGPRDGTAGPGAIRAFGDHKGSGLAFMCEILGGSLTGARRQDPAGASATACSRSMSIPSASIPNTSSTPTSRATSPISNRPDPRRARPKCSCPESPSAACARNACGMACR